MPSDSRKSIRSRVQTQKARDMQGASRVPTNRPRPPKSKRSRQSKGKKRATDSTSSSATSDDDERGSRGNSKRQRAGVKRRRRAHFSSFEEVADVVNQAGEPDEEVEEDLEVDRDRDEEELNDFRRQRGARGSGRTANDDDNDETVGYKCCSASIY